GSTGRKGRATAGEGGLVGEYDLPEMWRAGAARGRDDGHLRRLDLVFRALSRSAQRRGAVLPRAGRSLASGRRLRRRARARSFTLTLLPLLDDGDERAGPLRGERARAEAGDAGHRQGPRRREDVEIEGQRRLAARDHRR